MRIAVISTLQIGGAATAMLRITNALRKAGHECTVFVLEDIASGRDDVVPLQRGVLSFEASCTAALFNFWATLTTEASRREAKSDLFSDQTIGLFMNYPIPQALREADVIHLHWVSGMLPSPVLLGACEGKKVIWTLHDSNPITGGCHHHASCLGFERECGNCPMLACRGGEDASASGHALKRKIYSLLNPSIAVPSAWLGEKVKRSSLLGGSTIEVIPNCVDTNVFRPLDRLEQRRRFGCKADSFVLLVGAEFVNSPSKNCQVLPEALALLAQDEPQLPVEVLVYGHGHLDIQSFPTRHIGFVNEAEMLAGAYNAADLYVHTSLMDNLPNSLCEAQCCGTPVLAFDVGGCKETMQPGKTGFLLQEQGARALADSLLHICRKRDMLPEMRAAACVFAEARFGESKVSAAYEHLWSLCTGAGTLQAHSELATHLMQNQLVSLAALAKSSRQELASFRYETYMLRQNPAPLVKELGKKVLRRIREKCWGRFF